MKPHPAPGAAELAARRTRVIALGQRFAGDDGVGLVVLEALREALRGARLPESVELLAAPDASRLVELVQFDGEVVIVDALLADPPGRVLLLDEPALARLGPGRLSSHGLGVAQAIGLARALAPALIARRFQLVGVTIAPPRRGESSLSDEVARALPEAVARVRTLIGA